MLTLNTIRSLGGFPGVGGQIAYQPFSPCMALLPHGERCIRHHGNSMILHDGKEETQTKIY